MKISEKTHVKCGAYIGKFQLQITKYIFTSIAHKLTGDLKKKKKIKRVYLMWMETTLESWELWCLCLSQAQNKRLLNVPAVTGPFWRWFSLALQFKRLCIDFTKIKFFTGALRRPETHTPNKKFELNAVVVNHLAYWGNWPCHFTLEKECSGSLCMDELFSICFS